MRFNVSVTGFWPGFTGFYWVFGFVGDASGWVSWSMILNRPTWWWSTSQFFCFVLFFSVFSQRRSLGLHSPIHFGGTLFLYLVFFFFFAISAITTTRKGESLVRGLGSLETFARRIRRTRTSLAMAAVATVWPIGNGVARFSITAAEIAPELVILHSLHPLESRLDLNKVGLCRVHCTGSRLA